MANSNSFKVAESGLRRGGYRKPSVLVTWNDLNDMDFEHLSVVEVSLPEAPEETVHAFVEGTFQAEIEEGTIITTETLDRALPDDVGRATLVPSDPPEAEEVRVGRPIDIHMSGAGGPIGAPEEMVQQAAQELIETFDQHRGSIHAGESKRVEKSEGGRGVAVSAEVVETSPGQIAKVTEQTDVLIKGRDYR